MRALTDSKPKNARVFKRAPDDWYVEEARCTAQLVAAEGFEGHIHDPACGQGNIVCGLLAAGLVATGSDIRERAPGAPWFVGISDFTGGGFDLLGARNCVTNPPYFRGKGTESFIRRAVALAPGKVCVFTEARFLFGKTRGRTLYRDIPPDRIYFITPRPSCPPGQFLLDGGKAEGGSPDFVWLVWDERTGQARGRWLV